jgi:hypothetical protein
MRIHSDNQLVNTERKLSLLQQWIAEARSRPESPENAESLRSLVQMANQLREEIVLYRSQRKRRAS